MATDVAALTKEQIYALLHEAEERLASKELVSKRDPAAQAPDVQFSQSLVAASDASAVASTEARKEAKPVKSDNVVIRVPHVKTKKDKKTPDDAGPDWFGLPKTLVTPETKREFQVLRMRGVIDAKHHFRKDNRRDLIPKFSAFGTIVDTAVDSKGSLTRKQRKQTITEEVLSSSKESFKKRYNKIQEQRTKGKKAFYKKLVAQRRRRP